ncbi:hypothetical protein GGTG_13773 [Gaeumannomyces tritici R3-111a-1]|uniref:Uncharacterized protein n=1 Tax=Gaeumannomyces tritici (strain R3-111a-1) TaxID=644352 RepID=J3PJT4_GAET3|nr:hypothetical protein GGTG_13773 [Gaeumannomyces tritici R3-111a-1]EJT68657.1 hypothetical protein GGTG_13773 [Gaeumannomyces tritici R3-111a-1]
MAKRLAQQGAGPILSKWKRYRFNAVLAQPRPARLSLLRQARAQGNSNDPKAQAARRDDGPSGGWVRRLLIWTGKTSDADCLALPYDVVSRQDPGLEPSSRPHRLDCGVG